MDLNFNVYILFSKTKNSFYVGYSANLEERVIRHNQKSKGFTGNINDWELVYKETYESKEIAVKREKQIKRLEEQKENRRIDCFRAFRLASEVAWGSEPSEKSEQALIAHKENFLRN